VLVGYLQGLIDGTLSLLNFPREEGSDSTENADVATDFLKLVVKSSSQIQLGAVGSEQFLIL